MASDTLHYGTLAAAAVLLAVHVQVLLRFLARAAAAGVRGHVFVILADLANDVVEGVVDVDAGPGRSLDELAAERARERGTLCK